MASETAPKPQVASTKARTTLSQTSENAGVARGLGAGTTVTIRATTTEVRSSKAERDAEGGKDSATPESATADLTS